MWNVSTKPLQDGKETSAGDRRKASNLAASYAPGSFGGLKEVGAALDDVLARLANSYKENQTIFVYLTKKESELTRAKATSTSTSQTPTPEATLRKVPEQVKDKSRLHPPKHDGLRRKSRRGKDEGTEGIAA